MKYIVWIISSLNIYLGLRFFLNVIHILQTSKYSKTATAIYAILFLAMGGAGFYFSIVKNDNKLALLAGLGVWGIIFLMLLFNMLTGNYK